MNTVSHTAPAGNSPFAASNGKSVEPLSVEAEFGTNWQERINVIALSVSIALIAVQTVMFVYWI